MKTLIAILAVTILTASTAFAVEKKSSVFPDEYLRPQPTSAVAPEDSSEKSLPPSLQQMVEIANLPTEAGGRITWKHLVEIARILTKYMT